MIVNVSVPIAMVVIGLLILALSGNKALQDFGRGMMYAGLFVFALYMSGHRFNL